MRVLIGLLVMLVGTASGEVSCYRTPAEAAVRVGVQDGGGYRLEFVRRDAFGRKSWATVRSCGHPEWPSVVVATVLTTVESHLNDDRAVVEMGHPVVLAGRRVRVVEASAMVRLETSGVAQGNGQIGERIWVRLAEPGSDGAGRLELAVVRAAELLEIER